MSVFNVIRGLFTSGHSVVSGLPDDVEQQNPIDFFSRWFSDAEKSGLLMPEALTLATASNNGQPSARMVLLKSFDENGFVFFTNYGSRKSRELAENPKAAMVFHWGILQRQVRIEGVVTKVSQEESKEYFLSRARGSRIGAWASKQSMELKNREELEQRELRYEEKFKDKEIPLPDFWGGFRLNPERIEFWQGRMKRLHDRVVFERSVDGWTTSRLYP